MAASAVVFLATGCGNEKLVVPKVTADDSDVFKVYERLSDAGFDVEITDGFRTGPSCQCENPIVDQWPPPGTRVERGSAVEITVGGPGWMSRGGQVELYYGDLRLPKLVGLRLDAADRWLSGHKVGWSAEFPRLPAMKGGDLHRAYVVTAQDPSAGSYVDGSPPVVLTVAPTEDIMARWRGQTVVVPHINDEEDLTRAYERLHARGLLVTTNQRLKHGPYIPVLGQRPAAGTTVSRGTAVRLILDSAPSRRGVCCDGRRLRMPDLVGRNLEEARGWLDKRYLYWDLADAPALPPTNSAHLFDRYVVTSQKPAPGTRIPESIPGSADDLKPIELLAKLVR